ncbi:MAG: hypothetical protein J7L54_04225, partial [Elusimicrobia bacterium]|nr:hypothetical protein [Elusimicrobiota bacterium]
EGYDKKMNVKSRAIIRMGGVNPAPACRGGTACIFCLMQKMGSIGRCDLPGGDFELLKRTIKEKLFVLPDETKIFPGHFGDTTVGREKRTNPFLNVDFQSAK